MARRFDVVAYLKLFRFPLVFTAIADSAAGYTLSTWGRTEYRGTPLLVDLGKLALISGGLYLFGMSLNDIADRRKDAQQAPGKVLPSGRISVTGAWFASVSMLGISIAALLVLPGLRSVQQIIVWFLTLGAILGYDLGFGKYPPVMGLVRAFNLCLGVTFTGSWEVWEIVLVASPTFVYVTALTYVSTLEDTEVVSRRVNLGVGGMATGLLLAALSIPAVRFAFGGHARPPWMQEMALILSAWVVIGWLIRRARAARDKRGVMLLVRDGVASIIFLDAILIASAEYWQLGLLLAALILPAALSLSILKRLA